MSTQTATVYVHATPSVIAAAAPGPPPIVQFGRLAGHVLTLTFSYLSRATVLISRYMHVPLSVLYTPVIYLLGPVIVLSQVLLQIFVFSPYALLSSLIRNVYPIYVFVGAAFICAAAVGYVARLVSTGLVYAFFAPSPPSALRSGPEKEVAEPATRKTRVRKRVSIKEER